MFNESKNTPINTVGFEIPNKDKTEKSTTQIQVGKDLEKCNHNDERVISGNLKSEGVNDQKDLVRLNNPSDRYAYMLHYREKVTLPNRWE